VYLTKKKRNKKGKIKKEKREEHNQRERVGITKIDLERNKERGRERGRMTGRKREMKKEIMSSTSNKKYNLSMQALLLAYFPYFGKKNRSRLMRSPCCLCICSPPLNF
jgi:hypothetical protein